MGALLRRAAGPSGNGGVAADLASRRRGSNEAASALHLEDGGAGTPQDDKLRRTTEYEELKRESLTDAGAASFFGAVLTFALSGPDAAAGYVLGSLAGVAYLQVLHKDVDSFGEVGGGTPLDPLRPLRLVRLIIPVLLVLALAAQAALTAGVDTYLSGIHWEPGANFVGVVSSNAALYAAALGYVSVTATLRLRNIAKAVPELSEAVKAMPGSAGVASRFSEAKKAGKQAPRKPKEVARVVPVLLVSGPRGCGKTTLVAGLRQADSRFVEPEWLATVGGGTVGFGCRVVGEEAFSELEEVGSLAVSYRPYGDDGEQIGYGLPASAVIEAAESAARSAAEGEGGGKGKGACVLDVDAPTAKALLNYDWEAALAPYEEYRGERLEIRLISVWVCLPNLDMVIERNRQRILKESGSISTSMVEQQLRPLRAQAASDTEWALTEGNFDFTLLNEEPEAAAAEMLKAARYCFSDPF